MLLKLYICYMFSILYFAQAVTIGLNDNRALLLLLLNPIPKCLINCVDVMKGECVCEVNIVSDYLLVSQGRSALFSSKINFMLPRSVCLFELTKNGVKIRCYHYYYYAK